MAFNINKFAPVGGQSTRGASPQVFSYGTTDSVSTIETNGYFNGARTYLEANDIIIVMIENRRHIYHIVSVPLNGDVVINDNIHISIAQYYMQDNTTETVISTIDEFVKGAGTTTAGSLVEDFDVTTTSNKAVYTGKLTNYFKIGCTISITNGSNKVHKIGIGKNGTTILSSQEHVTTGAAGRAENVFVQSIVELAENDYIEMFVANSSDTTNITVVDMNLIIERIN